MSTGEEALKEEDFEFDGRPGQWVFTAATGEQVKVSLGHSDRASIVIGRPSDGWMAFSTPLQRNVTTGLLDYAKREAHENYNPSLIVRRW